jgi:hypothetical protein
LEKTVAGALLAWLTDARSKHAQVVIDVNENNADKYCCLVSELGFVYPCVAHMLRAARRDATVRETSAVFLQSWRQPVPLEVQVPSITDGQQVYWLYQHILDHRTQPSIKEDNSPPPPPRMSPAFRRRSEQRIEALLSSFQDASASEDLVGNCLFRTG